MWFGLTIDLYILYDFLIFMRLLKGDEEKRAMFFLEECVKTAQDATCLRLKCGSVIAYDGEIIGRGFNSPASESQRRCLNSKDMYDKKVTDKTCCVHAEQRAIKDAIGNDKTKLKGSRIYFMSIDDKGKGKRSGDPYCTICSKDALDEKIKEFVLWHKKGICVYDTEEYNDLSYAFNQK